MGSIFKGYGILGGFSGTVGTVVGSTWKGKEVIKAKMRPSSRPQSLAQEIQRAKFKLVVDFLTMLKALLRVTFRITSKPMSGINNAVSHALNNAVGGLYPNLEINYALVKVAQGKELPNTTDGGAHSTVAGQIDFTWVDNSGFGTAKATDKAILVAYCPELKKSVYTIAGPARSALSGSLPMQFFSGMEVHTWLSFINESGRQVAESVYTGKVTVL